MTLLLAPKNNWPTVKPCSARPSTTCWNRANGLFFAAQGHHVSPIHRKGVPSAYSKYLPARGPLLATRTNPWRVGFAAFSSALHSAQWQAPFPPPRTVSVEEAEYAQSPAAGAANRAFHTLPPSQKPGTA